MLVFSVHMYIDYLICILLSMLCKPAALGSIVFLVRGFSEIKVLINVGIIYCIMGKFGGNDV